MKQVQRIVSTGVVAYLGILISVFAHAQTCYDDKEFLDELYASHQALKKLPVASNGMPSLRLKDMTKEDGKDG